MVLRYVIDVALPVELWQGPSCDSAIPPAGLPFAIMVHMRYSEDNGFRGAAIVQGAPNPVTGSRIHVSVMIYAANREMGLGFADDRG